MKLKKSDLKLISEAQANGFLISMSKYINYKGKDLASELSNYFKEKVPNYDGYFDDIEYETEDMVFLINKYIQDNSINKRLLDFPFTSGYDVHLLPITQNLQLEIILTDEYYGDGDYSKHIKAHSFVINEDTTKQDVDQLIDFINKCFLFM